MRYFVRSSDGTPHPDFDHATSHELSHEEVGAFLEAGATLHPDLVAPTPEETARAFRERPELRATLPRGVLLLDDPSPEDAQS